VLLPIELKGTAVARSGRVLVEIGDAQVGGLYLPGPARRDVGQAIQDQVGRLLDRQQFTVRTVAIGEGKLTVVGAPAAAPGTPKGGAT